MNYYIGVDKHEGLGESAGDKYYETGRKSLPKTASDGEYFTVTFKLKEREHTKITALQFYISGVQHTDTANPEIMTADYFYVGPLTDKSGHLGQSLNIAPEKVNELYFGFDNSKQAQDRYTQPQYRKNGGQYYSETDFYSIAQYAYTRLGKTVISEELQALCAELLRYGSAAQVFKGYATGSLAHGPCHSFLQLP